MTLEQLRQKSHQLPLEPGVYIMKDKTGKVIYVGKAKKLKNRVSSYFMAVESHLPKVYQMVMHVNDFDFIVTQSEFEALVLECSLIKQYSPKYNILLKDDKGYHYIKITPGDWPDIQAAKQKIDDGSTYIGPYTSSFIVTQSVELAKKAFLLPSCKKRFPQDIGRERPCLNYHIKQCCGSAPARSARPSTGRWWTGPSPTSPPGPTRSSKTCNRRCSDTAKTWNSRRPPPCGTSCSRCSG